MFRKDLAILCLLITSLVASTIVHAQESSGLTQLECVGEVHSEQNDAPPSGPSGDTDKAVAHHHGCHTASSFLGGAGPAYAVPHPGANAFAMMQAHTPPSRPTGPDLRPPIA
ncbi:hypothetical protein ACMT1E_01585 [Sphingomonas flavalba]|uniref:hypothetical protein n=1 Tax=Sphingomonas flavalba TaxID=2559804 RepID=UPI0039E1B2A6